MIGPSNGLLPAAPGLSGNHGIRWRGGQNDCRTGLRIDAPVKRLRPFAAGTLPVALGSALILGGCDAACLEDEAADLRLRFAAAVETRHLDVLDPESFAAVVDGLPVLPDRIIRSNFTGPAAIPAILANGMAARECWWASVRRVGQTRRSCLSRIGGRDWYKTKPASVTSTFASG